MSNILIELSYEHYTWINMATEICGCEDKAKDLVQDMYLKMGSCNTEIRNTYSYIYRVIKNIHLNQDRKFYLDKKNRKDKVIFIELNPEIWY